MDLKEYITQVYEYSYWANQRYLKVAESLNRDQLNKPQGHSWGDVHSVLLHMLSSETVWLKRWNGEAPTHHLDPAGYPTVAAVKSAWAQAEADMRAFIGSQTEQSLQAIVAYSNFAGEKFRVPLWQMLMHVANHETHHRGELAAMFAVMQVPHPEDEVIQYFLSVSGQKKF
jgi:uncharacterized damage-inducible protein DinB